MGKAGIGVLIGMIVLISVGLNLLGQIESSITDAITENKTQSGVTWAASTALTEGQSFYGTKTSTEGATSLPPGVTIELGASGVCDTPTINSARTAIVCGGSPAGSAGKITYPVEKAGDDASAMSLFKIGPFLFVIGSVILVMVGASIMSFMGGFNITLLIIRAVVLVVGFILTPIISAALADAREIFSYAVEYTGISGALSLVMLLYIVTLIVAMIGTGYSGYKSYRGGGGMM